MYRQRAGLRSATWNLGSDEKRLREPISCSFLDIDPQTLKIVYSVMKLKVDFPMDYPLKDEGMAVVAGSI
jgi:hypothetical protein